MNRILQETKEALLVDRSDSAIQRRQLTLLNSDCPKSPIAAVVMEVIGRTCDLNLVTRADVTGNSEEFRKMFNKLLKGTGVELGSQYTILDNDEPCVKFLLPAVEGNNAKACVQYTLVNFVAAEEMKRILNILHKKGIVGDIIMQGGLASPVVATNAIEVMAGNTTDHQEKPGIWAALRGSRIVESIAGRFSPRNKGAGPTDPGSKSSSASRG